MKTPQDWATAWIIRQEEFSSYAKDGLVAESFIAEIQRDAREGMVPMQDLMHLVDAAAKNVYTKGSREMAILEREVMWLRAKHPNLFTK